MYFFKRIEIKIDAMPSIRNVPIFHHDQSVGSPRNSSASIQLNMQNIPVPKKWTKLSIVDSISKRPEIIRVFALEIK